MRNDSINKCLSTTFLHYLLVWFTVSMTPMTSLTCSPRCLNPAPLRKTKLTRPPAPWLNAEDIRQLQNERNKLRYLAHKTQSAVVWQAFRDIRNRIKTTIKK